MTAGGGSRSAILPSTEVNVSKIRPMTGLARVDNRHQMNGTANSSSTHTRIESVGYYQSKIQSKIDEIINEIDRLRFETAEGDSESRKTLENKYDDLSKVVQNLEGDLADYNLAKEHARSGNSSEDIQNSTRAIIGRNQTMEKEIDKIFFSRKKVEDEISRMESELKRLHAAVESRFLESNDDENLPEYRALVKEIESIIAETKQEEDDILLMRHKIKMMESNSNSQGFHTEYNEEKSRVESLKKQLEKVEDDIKMSLMSEDEAREHLLGKVLDTQYHIKKMEAESSRMQSEVKVLHEMQKELRSELRMKSSDGAVSAYERLLKKDSEIKRYFEELPKTKSKLEEQRSQLTSRIDELRIAIRDKENMTAVKLPSKEEMKLMKDEVEFTGKHLDANQETINLLQQQKKSRMEELAHVDTLEERIRSEIEELEKQTISMRKDIEKYNNPGVLQDSADATKEYLGELSKKYKKRIQFLDGLFEESTSQYRHKVEQLESSSGWKETQELKSKLCSQGRDIFELQEKLNSAKARTAYGQTKADCLAYFSRHSLTI